MPLMERIHLLFVIIIEVRRVVRILTRKVIVTVIMNKDVAQAVGGTHLIST